MVSRCDALEADTAYAKPGNTMAHIDSAPKKTIAQLVKMDTAVVRAYNGIPVFYQCKPLHPYVRVGYMTRTTLVSYLSQALINTLVPQGRKGRATSKFNCKSIAISIFAASKKCQYEKLLREICDPRIRATQFYQYIRCRYRFFCTHGIGQASQVRGTYVDSTYMWKGIPYAKAPVGDLRFRAPQAPDSWTGIRDASQFGPACPQGKRMLKSSGKPSEDCLSINVWAPAVDGKKRPVMFWIHGGGFLVGQMPLPCTTEHAWPRNGDVIVVNINYRLGALGFLYFKDIKGAQTGFDDNIGMLDQIAALRWVKDNISAFGGDPNSVTIFGESAGALSVLTLMATPSAQGLFKEHSGKRTNRAS
ncbi:unnamed protein product [Sphagnum jensenii]|uniref:Carboxylic ester hydrolase n=1 Tax=Sphagnum jensenii TaxID=128206 RepID=A0ABP0VK11_9BRYO